MVKAKLTSFEDSYKRLEQVIARLDSGNLPLDESVALYEEGMKLAQLCEQQLDNAEIKVTQLIMDAEKTDPPTET